jgi:hypothetical protein
MTQLDSITWLPQIFWLFIIFFIIYILIYIIYGPVSFYSQNVRTKKIERHYRSIISYDFLNVDIMFKRFNVIVNNF